MAALIFSLPTRGLHWKIIDTDEEKKRPLRSWDQLPKSWAVDLHGRVSVGDRQGGAAGACYQLPWWRPPVGYGRVAILCFANIISKYAICGRSMQKILSNDSTSGSSGINRNQAWGRIISHRTEEQGPRGNYLSFDYPIFRDSGLELVRAMPFMVAVERCEDFRYRC